MRAAPVCKRERRELIFFFTEEVEFFSSSLIIFSSVANQLSTMLLSKSPHGTFSLARARCVTTMLPLTRRVTEKSAVCANAGKRARERASSTSSLVRTATLFYERAWALPNPRDADLEPYLTEDHVQRDLVS